jgi:phosphoglycerate dehydrogenase-like enzyme
MTFHVGVTRDLRAGDGRPLIDVGLDEIGQTPALEWSFLAPHQGELTPADIAGFDSLLVWDTAIRAATVTRPEHLLHVARLGVGLDAVDVNACTAAGVLVTITPDAVRRPVASGAAAFMLALSHRVCVLDRVVRHGQWYGGVNGVGRGLTHRTLGIIGLGNIGSELARLMQPWEMEVLAYDPYPPASLPDGVALTQLEDLLRRSDFIVLTCPLNEQTYHLIDASQLSLVKYGAHLINVARGPIVHTDALVAALQEGRLAGAALDVLEDEPPDPLHPLLAFDNVMLSPHAIAATDDFNLAVGRSAIATVRSLADHRIPANVVNPEALDHPRLKNWFGADSSLTHPT